MAVVCTRTQEWVEEKVSKPVEEWEERREEKCKGCPWYDPRGWVCWFVSVLVKVVRSVVVTVGKWVTRTVCKIVAVVIDLVRDVLGGLWDVVVGIFALDWRRILDGLLRIGIGSVLGTVRLARIVTLGDTVEFIRDEINTRRLRAHVRGLLEAAYSGDVLAQIKAAIRLDHGAFGLRLDATACRTVLDSETPSPDDPTVPNLVMLHQSGRINLRELCGFEFTEGFWNRKRYKTLKKDLSPTGGGGGELDDPISEMELNVYLDSRGAKGPGFIVLPMRDGVLAKRVRTAQEKGRELALMLSFDQTTVPVTQGGFIVHYGYNTLAAHAALSAFLVGIVGRADKRFNDPEAQRELCHPVAVGIFRYTDTLRGLASNLRSTRCGLSGHDASGVTFIDNRPDEIWKYVVIHELGHYFGLCHANGVDRIMFSPRQATWWRGWLLPRTLANAWLQGEPSFTLDEAKAVWDYVVANFDAACLANRRAPRPAWPPPRSRD